MSLGQEIVLRNARGMLRRRWLSILAGLVAVLAGVAVLTHFWPRKYQAEATILVEERSRGGDAPALEVLQRLGRGNSIETEIELLQSRRVLEPVVDSLDLHVSIRTAAGIQPAREVLGDLSANTQATPGEYQLALDSDQVWSIHSEPTHALLERFKPGEMVTAAGLSFTAPAASTAGGLITVMPVARAVAAIQRHIGASLVNREADLILLTCDASSALTAHQLCQAIPRSYIMLRSELQRSEATSTAAFLRTQVARVGEQLTVVEDSLESFQRSAGAVVLQEQASAEVQDASKLSAQREQVEAERAALSDLIARVDSRVGGDQRYVELASFPTLFQNDAITALLKSLVELQNRRAELAVRRMNPDPDLAAIDARIAEIQRQLHATATGYEGALAGQVRSLDKALTFRRGQMSGMPQQQMEAARQERQVALLTDLHHSLEMRLREAEVAEAVDLPSVEIADSASMPLDPSSPNARVNMALGLILGLGFGFGIALVRENRDTRIYEWRQLEEQTKIPVLSLIPRVVRSGPLLDVAPSPIGALGPEAWGAPRRAPPVGVKNGARKEQRVAQAPRGDKDDLAFEAFRSLGSDLSFITGDLDSGVLRSIAITSAGPGEGKTFTACNLALARASNGTRTLLIDCDIHAGGVSVFFDLPRKAAGLCEVLEGRASLSDVCRELHLNDGHTLGILTAGKPSPEAGGLLERSQFGEIVQKLSRQYDLIVLDTPPLNILNDASAAARAADAVLIVVRKGVTDRHALELTLERLRRIGAPPIGLVFGNVALPEPYLRHSGTAT